MNSHIILFYLNQITTNKKNGYLFNEILQWNDEQLEQVHDYIQYLFPLKEKSQYNKNAPLLTDIDINQFKNNPLLRKHVRKALRKMLSFYGIKKIINTTFYYQWNGQKKQWLSLNNHNYLRLTRIMKFLIMIKMEYESIQLFIALCNIYHSDYNSKQLKISQNTMKYWKDIFISYF